MAPVPAQVAASRRVSLPFRSAGLLGLLAQTSQTCLGTLAAAIRALYGLGGVVGTPYLPPFLG